MNNTQSNEKIISKTILHFVGRYKWLVILSAILGFLTVGSNTALLITSAYLISKASLMPHIGELQLAIVAVRLFGISRAVFRYAERLLTHHITFKILTEIRVWFYESVEPLAPTCFAKQKSGDFYSRITSDVENLEHFFSKLIAPPIVAALSIVLSTLIFLFIHPLSALILFISLLLSGLILPYITHKMTIKLGVEGNQIKGNLNTDILDFFQGLPELVIFNQKESVKSNLLNQQETLISVEKKNAIITSTGSSLNNLIIGGATCAVIYAAALSVINDTLDPIFLAVLPIGVLASFEAVSQLSQSFQHLESARQSAANITSIIRSEVTHSQTGSSPELPIKFNNVSFAYPDTSHQVLSDLNLEIKQGDKIIITGASGMGKSSLINLIHRFYQPSKGKITFNGVDIDQYSSEDISQTVSTSLQAPYIFNRSIKENICMSDSIDNELLEQAIDRSQASEFINNLPQGIESYTGEMGSKLSGGEKRRIAIARAIYHKTPLLILDEPTADLDPITSEKLLDELLSHDNKQTTVIITHQSIKYNNDHSVTMIDLPMITFPFFR